ncbi:hypothetical protein A2U01_0063147, partial [Trifolium medium]|nr:hypothetical protein [Trifolium medium]
MAARRAGRRTGHAGRSHQPDNHHSIISIAPGAEVSTPRTGAAPGPVFCFNSQGKSQQ